LNIKQFHIVQGVYEMPLTPGQILNNRYRIVKMLGQGGFGAVYRAWDLNLDHPRAIKENLDTSPQAQRQFKREAQILDELVHPNLPRVIDHFVIPNQGQYLVMDFVEGQDLGEMLRNGPLPEEKILPWIAQVCDALSYLHSQNPPVIHRDVKPGNIRITPEGKAMLVDFGISKVYDPNIVTTVGARAVTPGYSPPEQYGKGVTDARSDLYALGATMYHLLTNQVPPESVELLTKNAPPQVVDFNPAISEVIGAAIAKAMALDREARWANAQEFKQAITTQPVSARGRGATAVAATQVVPLPAPKKDFSSSGVTRLSGRKFPYRWLATGGLAMMVVILAGWLIESLLNQDRKQTPEPTSTPEITMIEPVDTPTPTEPIKTSPEPTATIAPHPTDTMIPVLEDTIIDEFGVKMKLIPAGEFRMGSESGERDESPVHTVYLEAFYMDVYEVTNAMYARCVEAGACSEPYSNKSSTRDFYYGNATFDDYPAIYVSWEQARDYCEWRGARLPSEAEWEKAARGGLEGKLYPWGDQELDCSLVNFYECGRDTVKVGSYASNDFGLFDMAGNVWEWVMDWYSSEYYASSPYENPTGSASGRLRVLRGGSWECGSWFLRVSVRSSGGPDYQFVNINGFRCSR
jgi:formylglycine-generating enzyme required for sulfatase activity/serine/threonine protein kinase